MYLPGGAGAGVLNRPILESGRLLDGNRVALFGPSFWRNFRKTEKKHFKVEVYHYFLFGLGHVFGQQLGNRSGSFAFIIRYCK